MAFDCDVLVCGGGPTGARAAQVLAQHSRRTIVLEARRAGAAKLCGGLLNTRAQELLREMVPKVPEHIILQPEQPALEYHDLDNNIRARYGPGYLNIDRAAFDSWLLGRARDLGADVRHGARVKRVELLEDGEGGYRAVLEDSELTAPALVDATGAGALARRSFNAELPRRLDCLQGEAEISPPLQSSWAVYQTRRTPFLGWLIPKPGGKVLVGAGYPPERLKRQRGQQQAASAEIWPGLWSALGWLLDYAKARGFTLSPRGKPLGAPLAWLESVSQLRLGYGQLYIAGEAAGLVSPFSGEGLSYALASGQRAAESILQQAPAELYARSLEGEAGSLRRSQLKAWVGASPALRPFGLLLLPRFTGRKLVYIPWRDGLDSGYNQAGGKP